MKSELNQSVDHFKRAAALAAQETSATVGPRFTAARDRVQPAAEKARGAATSSWDSALATLTPLLAAAAENVKQTGKDSATATKESAKATKESAKAAKASAKATRASARAKAAKGNKASSSDVKKTAKLLEKRANKAVGRKQSSGRGGKLVGLAFVGAVLGAGAAFVLRKRKAAQWDEYDPSAPITSAQQGGGADDAAFEPDYSATTTTTTTTATTAGAVTAADPALSGETTDLDIVDVDSPITTGDVKDQTASEQHSPTVARLASGQNKE
jgi:hypothetical protein